MAKIKNNKKMISNANSQTILTQANTTWHRQKGILQSASKTALFTVKPMNKDKTFDNFIPSNCTIKPEEMHNRKHNGHKIFNNIVTQNSTHDEQLLLKPANWNIINDCIYQNMNEKKHHEKIDMLNKLQTAAFNCIQPEQIHRNITLESKQHGYREFLLGLGFKPGMQENKYVLLNPNVEIVDVAVSALRNKIAIINLYEALNRRWQIYITSMSAHKSYKTQQKLLNELRQFDFTNNYTQYYETLNKLLKISEMKIYSRDGLILQMMTNIGFNITKIENDEETKTIFDIMEEIYTAFRTIENIKQPLTLTDYYTTIHDVNDDHKQNGQTTIPFKYKLSSTEVKNRKLKGIEYFNRILMTQNEEKYTYLLNPLNWDVLIDAIYLNMNKKSDKINALKTLKILAQKSCYDEKYRLIKVDSISIFEDISGLVAFLKGIGFKDDIVPKQMILKDPSSVTVDIAVNAVMYKIQILTKLMGLQTIWQQTIQIMFNTPRFRTHAEMVDELLSMDLYNNHDHYCRLLEKINTVSVKVLNQNKALQIAKTLLQQFGYMKVSSSKTDAKLQTLLKYLYSIYSQVKQIEEIKMTHKKQADEMIPSMQRLSIIDTEITTDDSQNIIQNIFDFGKNYYDSNDEKQLFSDAELAQMYNSDSFDNMEHELLTKLYEMQAHSFQVEEYSGYIKYFKEAKKQMKSMKCEDQNCEWDKKTVHLWSLNQRQIVHVMFYHTDDYEKIASSETRASRFRQEPRTRTRLSKSDQIPITEMKTDNLLTTISKYGESKNDSIDEKLLEPGANCPDGNNCKQLLQLLTRCSNIQELDYDNKNIDECRDEIDHCLEYHGNFRSQCIFTQNCKFVKGSKQRDNNRFVQLHAHFYHDITIDSDEIEMVKIKNREIHNEERIQYKLGSESNENNSNPSYGILEFGSPFILSHKSEAKFKNPKQEILKNSYHSLKKTDWNELLRKCVMYAKSRDAKIFRLNMKEIVALKLYTDFDYLQREFRMCFRENDEKYRKDRQKQFYFWNKL
eukprot:255479_1